MVVVTVPCTAKCGRKQGLVEIERRMKDGGKERVSGYILRFGRVKHWINVIKRIELNLYCTALSQIITIQIFSEKKLSTVYDISGDI